MGLGCQILAVPGGAGNLYWKNGATSLGGFSSFVMVLPKINFEISVLFNQFV
jgi:hypothetical protein